MCVMEKAVKEIAKELKLIRRELQKKETVIKIDGNGLESYTCMSCDWSINNTNKILDGTSCPKCKANTVIPKWEE